MQIADSAEDTIVDGMEFLSNGQVTDSVAGETVQGDGAIRNCKIYDTDTDQVTPIKVTSNVDTVVLEKNTITDTPNGRVIDNTTRTVIDGRVNSPETKSLGGLDGEVSVT